MLVGLAPVFVATQNIMEAFFINYYNCYYNCIVGHLRFISFKTAFQKAGHKAGLIT